METYLLFAGAFLISVATPGPDVVVVVGRALAARRASKCLSLIAGILVGKLLLLAAALYGLAALAATLGSLFVAVKFAGAVYLAHLGIKMWRRPPREWADVPDSEAGPAKEVALGLAMSLGNPVAILFYAALLPNVIDVQSATPATVGVLMAIVGLCTLAVYMAYAMSAARVAGLFRSPVAQRRVNRTSGTAMVGAAVMVATR